MKKICLLLITILLTITLGLTEVKAYNSNEIIPFNPDPSLVTEWDVSEQGWDIYEVFLDTPIFKIILPDGIEDIQLTFTEIYPSVIGEYILWILPPVNDYPIFLELEFTDVYVQTLWLGGRQSIEPTMNLSYFSMDEYSFIKSIYLYPDAYFDISNVDMVNYVDIYSYNFEYELNYQYQLGYNDGWGEKNKMTDITFLIIGLIIFIIANVLGFIYKNNLLTALSGLLWLLPIFLVDNVFIKIFSIIIMIITFLFSFKERGDYYV